jgi:hypothetical protein
LNCVLGQARGQQAGAREREVVGVPAVVVVMVEVMLHWYWDSSQGEEQREPMWQQTPAVVVWGSIMQLGGVVSCCGCVVGGIGCDNGVGGRLGAEARLEI